MTEMNEAEVLAEVALETWRGGPSFEVAADMCNRIAVAVAAKAREMDAARGGVLVASAVKAWLDNVEANGTGIGLIRDHLAAQGRTIAEKDVRIAELEAEATLDAVATRIAAAANERADAERERDVAWAALAALRQAFRETAMRTDPFDDELCWCSYRRSSDTERHGPDCLPNRELLAATPAEHPDAATREDYPPAERAKRVVLELETLLLPYASGEEGNRDVVGRVRRLLHDVETLRGIRERASDNAALGRIAMERTGLEGEVAVAVRDYLLGDSGPSGGPGGPPLYRCSECGEPRAEHPDTAMLREVTAEHDALKQAAAPYLTHDGESWVAHVDPDPAATLRDIRKQSLVDMALKGTVPTQRNGWPTTPPDCSERDGYGSSRPHGGAMDEEDWRTVEEAVQSYRRRSLDGDLPSSVRFSDDALAALARLKDAPHRAAERMRHRADVAVLMLQPPASLLKQCETSAEANAVRGAWCAAINAAVDAIRALEVTP